MNRCTSPTASSFVHSFMTKFDDLWTTSSGYANYANVACDPRTRISDLHQGSAAQFSAAGVVREPRGQQVQPGDRKIDVIMYRITDARHTDAMIAAKNRGVPVRVISDPQQYRDETRLWDAWNIDRMYMAGSRSRCARTRA